LGDAEEGAPLKYSNVKSVGGCGTPPKIRRGVMSRIHTRFVLFLVVLAIALSFASAASAGWTWDEGAGWTGTEDVASAS
jgi:hypothetical protein